MLTTRQSNGDDIPPSHSGGPNCSHPSTPLNLPEEIMQASETFPFNSACIANKDLQPKILSYLPSKGRAVVLIEDYLETFSWYLKPVDREQILEELVPRFYDGYSESCESQVSETDVDIPDHDLSLLFAVFACGAVAVRSLQPSSDEAEQYKHLSRAALVMTPIFNGTSVASIQAISMLGAYDFFSCRSNTVEMAWKLHSFALCLAASVSDLISIARVIDQDL